MRFAHRPSPFRGGNRKVAARNARVVPDDSPLSACYHPAFRAKRNRGRLMFKKPHCPVIAIEEHYWDDELEKTFTGGEAGRPGEQYTRLKDLGALRLKEMDEAGIDIQVLSHGAPSTQKL